MSETTIPFVCHDCGHASTVADDFLPRFEEGNGFECFSEDACKRRQKRNKVLAEMQEMSKKPYVHPVDQFSKAALVACGAFMATVIFTGLHYLMGF